MPSVIVTCDGVGRDVFIDNQNQGTTDTSLSVTEGLHVFDLGLPENYLPPFQELFIEDDGTVVAFTLMAAVVARARKRRAAARKRVSVDKRARSPRGGRKTARKAAVKKGKKGKKATTSRRKRTTRKPR